MIMALPLFLLFSVYGVFNTYLPILLSGLGYSPAMIGLLQGIFEVSGFIFPVFVSSRVDKSGRYGQAMVGFALLMALILPPLVLFRHFALTALLLQFTPLVNPDRPESIAAAIGLSALAFALAVILMPGLLKVWPAHGPEGQTSDAPDAPAISAAPGGTPRSGLARYRRALSSFGTSYWIGITLIFFGFLGMVPSQRFLSLYVRQSLHLESYAGLWALSAAAEVPFMFLSGWFVRKFGTSKLLVASLAAIAVRNLVYALFPSFGGAVAGQLLHSVCFGLFHPAAILFVAERVPKRYMVVGMTIYTSVAVGISSALGNVLGGFVIQNLGYGSLFTLFALFPALGVMAFPLVRTRLYRFD